MIPCGDNKEKPNPFLPMAPLLPPGVLMGGEMSSTDLFNSSVAELRRKAQEHSAALWQLAQSVQVQQQQQQAAEHQLQVQKKQEEIKEEEEVEQQEQKPELDVTPEEQKVFKEPAASP